MRIKSKAIAKQCMLINKAVEVREIYQDSSSIDEEPVWKKIKTICENELFCDYKDQCQG